MGNKERFRLERMKVGARLITLVYGGDTVESWRQCFER